MGKKKETKHQGKRKERGDGSDGATHGAKKNKASAHGAEEVDGVEQELGAKGKSTAVQQHGGMEAAADTVTPAPSAGVRRSNASIVAPEVAQYLTEVIAHFHTLTDEEDKQLLVGNVMEELQGKEQKAASDPVCSHHMEALLGAAQPSQLTAFLSAIMDTGGLFELAVSPFGSHVAEKVLLRLESQLEVMTQAEYDAFVQVLQAIVQELCTDLWKFVTDRFATHVARRVLCLLCGQDVLPPGAREGKGGGPGKSAAGLASKVASKDSKSNNANRSWGTHLGCRFPDLLEALVSVLTREEYGGAYMEELLTSRYASPFVQAALKSASLLEGNRSLLATLIPSLLGTSYFYDAGNKNKVPSGAKLIEGVSGDRVYGMCTDPTTSHAVEAVMGVAQAVPGLVDAMLQRFFRGRVRDLAFHQSANFVLQAFLATTSTAAQVQPLHEELAPCIGDLLRCRRSGVVAALLAACGRANCCQKEACSALAAALAGMPHSSEGTTGAPALAPCLLCLDGPHVLGRNQPLQSPAGAGEPRLSPLGATILITVLRFSQNACREFTDSVASLGLWDLARCARDPSGSRVVEAFLDGSAPAKMKQGLLSSMVGGAYAAMALTGSGSFLLERCYGLAEVQTKEAIVKEALGCEKDVESKHWGPKLLQRLGVEAYKRDPQQWRKHLDSAAKTKAEFEKLFGSDEGGASKPSKQQKKKQQGQGQQPQGQQQNSQQQPQSQPSQSQLADGSSGGAQQEPGSGGTHDGMADGDQGAGPSGGVQPAEEGAEGEKSSGKKGKKRKGEEGAAAHVSNGSAQGQAEGQEQDQKKKKRKGKGAEGVDGNAAGKEGEGSAKKKKKKQKS